LCFNHFCVDNTNHYYPGALPYHMQSVKLLTPFSQHSVTVSYRLNALFFRLPTRNGKLVFACCTHPDEFWLPLLEKAFAKLLGNYQALEGGHAGTALAYLTGGIAERLLIKHCKDVEFIEGADRTRSIILSISPKYWRIDKYIDGFSAFLLYSVTS